MSLSPPNHRQGASGTIEWLNERHAGFQEINEEDRQEILYFVFLWSLFEARALNRRGSESAIRRFVQNCHERNLVAEMPLEEELTYFQNRYCPEGQFTYRFEYLNFSRGEAMNLVEKVLRGEETDYQEVATALLLIVYRFRNNLFHGEKWLYGIQGQFDNFVQANRILIKSMEANGLLR